MSSQTLHRPAVLLRRDSSPASLDRRRQYARRARRADLMVVLVWASAAAAVALFLASGGAAQFGTLGAALTSLGIATGLVGSDLILIMLVLAARVPVIDRTIGHDRAVALHRRLGKPALYLLLAHGILLLLGYAISSGIDPVAEIGAMLGISAGASEVRLVRAMRQLRTQLGGTP